MEMMVFSFDRDDDEEVWCSTGDMFGCSVMRLNRAPTTLKSRNLTPRFPNPMVKLRIKISKALNAVAGAFIQWKPCTYNLNRVLRCQLKLRLIHPLQVEI